MAKRLTYKSSGVDIDRANDFVRSIRGMVKRTHTPDVLDRAGSFGALFALPPSERGRSILVSSTDGVGTKLLIAQALDKHDTVGIDLVAMNVNDILCTGARPLFFLDYVACGRLDPAVLKSVMSGIAVGCRRAGCSLIGGETAEMPGMYRPQEYDLAGFAVGMVEEERLIDGGRIQADDVVIGLPSSGLHSNGYSLVRKAFPRARQKAMADQLLAPTRIYTKEILALLDAEIPLHGIAHITGGAFYDKMTKVLRKGLAFKIDRTAWTVPSIFGDIQRAAGVAPEEMYRTFNMGIGMIVVVPQSDVRRTLACLRGQRCRAFVIGEVIQRRGQKLLWSK